MTLHVNVAGCIQHPSPTKLETMALLDRETRSSRSRYLIPGVNPTREIMLQKGGTKCTSRASCVNLPQLRISGGPSGKSECQNAESGLC